ncbi:hypothetical protein ABT025_18515 [Streptomyces sp. NPDC002809]|uniref:hypothetical protein n=1 Tax=Streptomyces sp. NPDC002809 TaxID=3154433 RepID=UPI00332F0B75
MTATDQTYLVVLGAGVLQASHNARILAQHGDNQLGRPWSARPGLRIWNGNLTRIGHHDQAAFATEANTLLPAHMSVEIADHRHARLDDHGTWTRCPATATADGAVPITVALAAIHNQTTET